MPGGQLVLFDIDGTMLLDDAYAHGRAMVEAMRSVYGAEIADDAVQRTQPWGKTDLRIAREALTGVGLDAQAVEAGRAAWIRAAGEAFVADRASPREWHIRPGLPAALKQLGSWGMRLSLLTGNLRAIAVAKVERMGLTGIFDLAIGAYGDDAEVRAKLVPIARRRAGWPGDPWPRELTTVVGDTPGDVATARADGVGSVMFASPRHPKVVLGGAGSVVCDVDELLAVLEAWASVGRDQE